MKIAAMTFAGALLLAACTDGDNSASTEVDAFDVAVGDCINLPAADEQRISSFESVECNAPHDAEIFELFDLTDAAEFPGTDAVSTEAQAGCIDAFEPFVGIDYDSSRFLLTFVPPSEQSWNEADDREVICIVLPEIGEPQLTASVQGVAE